MDLEKLRNSQGRSGYLKAELVGFVVAQKILPHTQANKLLKADLVGLLSSKKSKSGKKTVTVRAPAPKAPKSKTTKVAKAKVTVSKAPKAKTSKVIKIVTKLPVSKAKPSKVPKAKPSKAPKTSKVVKTKTSKVVKVVTKSKVASKSKGSKSKAVEPEAEDDPSLSFLPPHEDAEPQVANLGNSQVDKCIARSKLPLLPHQIRVVRHLQTHPGVIAHWEPGAGKTLLAATAASCYLEGGPGRQVVVLLPKTLRGNFEKGLLTYGMSQKAIDAKFSFYGFVEYYNRLLEGAVPTKKFMLIIDEAQNLRKAPSVVGKRSGKERQSGKGSKGAIKAAKMADKVLVLTGGAFYNSPYDLEMLIALVRKRSPVSKSLFKEKTETIESTVRYARCTIDFYWGQKKEYPEVKTFPIAIYMDQGQYLRYMENDHKYRVGFETKRLDPQTKKVVKELSQPMWISNMRAEINSLFECPKCEWVMERLALGRKSLVYSFFKRTGIDLLKKRCDAAGISYLEVVGSTPKKKTRGGKMSVQEIVEAFNAGKVQVLFVTKAGVEGLDLKNTLDVIFLEATFNPSTDNQLIARAARFRSHATSEDKTVSVFFLILRKPEHAEATEGANYTPSIDDYLLGLVKEKTVEQEAVYEKFQAASLESAECLHGGPHGEWSDVTPSKKEAEKFAKAAAKAAAKAEKAAAKAAKAAKKKPPRTKKVGATSKKPPKAK